MKLYNTASRRLETFKPINPAEVKIYTCGPTVYSMPHIGNFAAYVYWDLLIRVLRADGYGVKRVLNLTDVGHLSSDSDDGEDKLEKGARATGRTVWEVAEYFAGKFLEDYAKLELIQPEVIARATDYIAEDEALVELLQEKGYTYETSDGVYFDTSKFTRYADFADLKLDQLRAGARVNFSSEKRNLADFAVWKFILPGEKHDMRWEYLDRPGYPGWHLECSSIIHAELGETIDIHTGGIDHVPVHHTDEIAQSEAAFGVKLSNYWLHCKHLTVNGEKISKSLGNGYTLTDLAERGFSPLDFKMWVLQGHYQSERDFSLESLQGAKNRRLAWRNQIALAYQRTGDDGKETVDEILATLNDNLNSPAVFAIIDQVKGMSVEFWRQVDDLFGLGLMADALQPNAEVMDLLNQREMARIAKDFARADQLRDQIFARGFRVLDTASGWVWQYVA